MSCFVIFSPALPPKSFSLFCYPKIGNFSWLLEATGGTKEDVLKEGTNLKWVSKCGP